MPAAIAPRVEGEEKGFSSPFSSSWGYELKWTAVSPRYVGNESALATFTERDGEIFRALADCRVATTLQLAKNFFSTPKSAAPRLKKLVSTGAIIAHTLQSKNRTVVLCTLGPLGAKAIGADYFPNWWEELDLNRTLNALIVSQLYLRMKKAVPARLLPGIGPYQAVLSAGERGAEFAVLAFRQGELPGPESRLLKTARLLVVAETMQDLSVIAPHLSSPARYTTDRALFTEPLHLAFWKYKDGRFEKDVVRQFEVQVGSLL